MRTPQVHQFDSVEALVERAVDLMLEALAGCNHEPRLALPTGRTFVPFYAELAVRTDGERAALLGTCSGFNLDELALPAGHPSSFAAYMEKHVWERTALCQEKFAIPKVVDLETATDEAGEDSFEVEILDSTLEATCLDYDRVVAECSPVDLALLGVGTDGHVGYNLPGTPREDTHVVSLSETLADQLHVPSAWRPLRAVTVGFRPLKEARRIFLLAFGKEKAEAVRRLIEGPEDEQWPCTILRRHAGLEVFIDDELASVL